MICAKALVTDFFNLKPWCMKIKFSLQPL